MKFKSKKHKKRRYKLFIILFLLGMLLSFKYLDKNVKKIDDKKFVNLLLNEAHFKNDNIFKKLFSYISFNSSELLFGEYKNKDQVKKVSLEETSPPLVYLYNSHQTEEYAPSNFIEFSINPTVMMVDYILEDIFNKDNFKTIVEERSIKEVLNKNSWNYNYSYIASRSFMEDTYLNNPTLKYFIDVHRDSLTKDKTTVTINDKSYAKILFLVGLENANFIENLSFIEKINEKIDEKYPNLSKGILQKSGPLVNGIYNQDFSKYTILIEVGGMENTPNEVLNTSLAFAECFLEVIKTEES